MGEQIKYLNEHRESKIRETFKDQKEKYGKDVLPTSKIQGLSGINAYVCEEVLIEMQEKKKIELVEIKGKTKYWKLI